MKYLLDTHVFLWWITADPRLSVKASEVMRSADAELYLSTASVWEMSIKSRLGKLALPKNRPNFIREQLQINSISPLPVRLDHAVNVADLPLIHRDPFDRMLISQATTENMPLISSDEQISQYDVNVLWL